MRTKKTVATENKKHSERYEYRVERMKRCNKEQTQLSEKLNNLSTEGWDHYFSTIVSSEHIDLYFRRWKR